MADDMGEERVMQPITCSLHTINQWQDTPKYYHRVTIFWYKTIEIRTSDLSVAIQGEKKDLILFCITVSSALP